MHQHCFIPSLHYYGIMPSNAEIWAKEQVMGLAGISVLCKGAEQSARPAGCCMASGNNS